MSRLTNKDDRGRYYTVEEKILIANEPVNPTTTWIVHNENRRYGSPIEKLGKLEDLEEEIGCPLEVVVKALKEGIYQEDGGRRRFPFIEYNGATNKFFFGFGTYCNVEDYGKEWFLKEDKSE